MKKRLAALLVGAVVFGATATAASADPAAPNDHNCAGFTSTLAPPGIGPAVSGLAQFFPSAIPTLTDAANCGANGEGK